MKLAIMQPYLFPYLGYFQLISSVDKFVFYDDVNFIKKGWINRNRIPVNGSPHFFTIPLTRASQLVRINELRIQRADLRWKRKLIAMFEQQYARAPNLNQGMSILNEVLDADTELISDLACHSVELVMQYVGLTREIVKSSACYGNTQLHGEYRILDICRLENANVYVNAPNGRTLYQPSEFAKVGVELRFIEPTLPPYLQGDSGVFLSGLSILDAIMHTSTDTVAAMVNSYKLMKSTEVDGVRSESTMRAGD